MRTSGLTPITLVPLLMAAFSLVSMIGTLQVDRIVHGQLYNYGLQFSYQWAGPYWTVTALIFAMGWFNILSALAFQIYVVTYERRQATAFVAAVRNEIMRIRMQQPQPETLPVEENQSTQPKQTEQPATPSKEQPEQREQPPEPREKEEVTPIVVGVPEEEPQPAR